MKSRCNCDSSCGENRYHDVGSSSCRFNTQEEYEAYWDREGQRYKDMTDKPAKWEIPPPPGSLPPEEQRLHDALCTIGVLLNNLWAEYKNEHRLGLALDIIDGALAKTWPAYGIVPAMAKEYAGKGKKNDGT